MFKSFKAVGAVYGVVARKDNGKVGRCSDGCIAGGKGCKVGVVWLVLVLIGGIRWESRKGENSHASFTQIKIAQF